MDRTMKVATRTNKRRGRRNVRAWSLFATSEGLCPYCGHKTSEHVVSSGQPHFLRLATDSEARSKSGNLYIETKPQGSRVILRRLTVANRAEIDMVGCLACADGIGTAQVVCYVRNVASGEVVRGRVPDAEVRTGGAAG